MGIQRLPKIFLTFSISNIFFVCPHPQCLFLCFFLHLSTKIIYDNFSQGKDIPKNSGNKHTLAILGSNYHSCIFLNHHNMPTYVLFVTRSQMHNNAYHRKPINQKMPMQNNVIRLNIFFSLAESNELKHV